MRRILISIALLSLWAIPAFAQAPFGAVNLPPVVALPFQYVNGQGVANGTLTATELLGTNTASGTVFVGPASAPTTGLGYIGSELTVLLSGTRYYTFGPNNLYSATDGVVSLGGASNKFNNSYLAGKALAYNNVTTQGLGHPAIYGENISSTQTANFTALTTSPGATAGRWQCAAVLTSTSATNTGTLQVTLDYVDSQGTTHTGDIIFLAGANAAPAATQTGASKEWWTVDKRFTVNNANTNIVLKVVTSGTVSYTVSPRCWQEG